MKQCHPNNYASRDEIYKIENTVQILLILDFRNQFFPTYYLQLWDQGYDSKIWIQQQLVNETEITLDAIFFQIYVLVISQLKIKVYRNKCTYFCLQAKKVFLIE